MHLKWRGFLSFKLVLDVLSWTPNECMPTWRDTRSGVVSHIIAYLEVTRSGTVPHIFFDICCFSFDVFFFLKKIRQMARQYQNLLFRIGRTFYIYLIRLRVYIIIFRSGSVLRVCSARVFDFVRVRGDECTCFCIYKRFRSSCTEPHFLYFENWKVSIHTLAQWSWRLLFFCAHGFRLVYCIIFHLCVRPSFFNGIINFFLWKNPIKLVSFFCFLVFCEGFVYEYNNNKKKRKIQTFSLS